MECIQKEGNKKSSAFLLFQSLQCNVQKKPNQTTSAEEQNFQNIAHSCGVASDLIAEKQRRMFLLSDIPDSGTGLIAARSISLGEVVIEEEPLVVVEAEVKNSNISW